MQSQQDAKNNPEPTEEEFEPKGFHSLTKLTRIDFDKHESINELYIDGTQTPKKSHIAYNIDIKQEQLVAKDIYAPARSHKELNIKKQEMTNERVKIELIKQYLENPRLNTAEVISTLLDNASKHYTITDEERESFKKLGEEGQDERRKIIEILRTRQDRGDRNLIQTLEACDSLLKTLNRTETNQAKTLSAKIEDRLDEITHYECFDLMEEENITNPISLKQRQELYELAKIKFAPFEEKNYKNVSSKEEALEIYNAEKKEFEKEKKADLSTKLSPYLKEEAESSEENKNIITQRLIENVEKSEELSKKVDDAIKLSNHITKESRSTKNFTRMYDLFASLSSAREITDNGQKAYVINRIKKDFRDLYEAGGENGTLQQIEKYIKETKGDKNLNFKDLTSLTKTEIPSDDYIDKIRQASLEFTIQDAVKEIDDNDTRKIVALNLKKAGDELVKAKKDIDNGIPLKWGKVVGIYNKVQENMIKEVISSAVNKSDLSSYSKEKLNETINSSKNVSFYPQEEEGLVDNIVDAMNAKNIMKNPQINSKLSDNQIDLTVKQSIKNSNLGKCVASEFKNSKGNNENRKDVPFDEKIRDISAKYHGNFANSLMSSSFLGLTQSRKTFNTFSSCVKGASTLKRGMDTKLSNTTDCLEKFKMNIEKDADELERVVSQSAQGAGALNPFIHLAQVIQVYKKQTAKKIEKHMNKIADSINGVAREVATGSTEMERRARGAILTAKADGNITAQTVHKDDTELLKAKLKQEYVTREIVDFRNAVPTDKQTIAKKLKELEVNYTPEYQDEIIDEKLKINPDISKMYDGKIDNVSGVEKNRDNLINKENVNENVGSQIDNNIEIANPNVENIDIPDTKNNFVNQDNESYNKFSTHMLEEGLVKIDVLQKKLAEMSLARDSLGKPLITEKEFREGTKRQNIKIDAETMGFVSEDGKDSFEYWKIENGISDSLLKKAMEKGYNSLEEDKLSLAQELIAKSLEVEKEILAKKEQTLLELTKSISTLENKGYSFENNQLSSEDRELAKDSLLALGIKTKDLQTFSDLVSKKQEIIDEVENAPRPKEKLDNLAKEVRGLFDDNKGLFVKNVSNGDNLKKRNTLSGAMNILLASNISFKKMSTILKTSSLATDVLSERGNDLNILGVATKTKSYLLKVQKDFSTKTNDFITEKEQNYNDTISLHSDNSILDNTKVKLNETALASWSEFMKDSFNFSKHNTSTANTNKEMTQVFDSSIDVLKEVGAITPDESSYGEQQNMRI